MCDSRPTKGVSEYRQHSHGRQHEPGQRRRIAHVLLQPQRQQHDIAEKQSVGEQHRDRADREVAPLEESQVDDGMLFSELPYQKQDEPHHREYGEGDDLRPS